MRTIILFFVFQFVNSQSTSQQLKEMTLEEAVNYSNTEQLYLIHFEGNQLRYNKYSNSKEEAVKTMSFLKESEELKHSKEFQITYNGSNQESQRALYYIIEKGKIYHEPNGKSQFDIYYLKTKYQLMARICPVQLGTSVDAQDASRDGKLLTIYIRGKLGTNEKLELYTASEYGKKLAKGFSDTEYTNNPTSILVYINETKTHGLTTASVYVSGELFKTESGKSVFTPTIIGKYIDKFADALANKKKG